MSGDTNTTSVELIDHEVRQLANTIALQAEAISTGRVLGPRWAAVQRLVKNAEHLAAITPDDRKQKAPMSDTNTTDQAGETCTEWGSLLDGLVDPRSEGSARKVAARTGGVLVRRTIHTSPWTPVDGEARDA